MRILLLSAAPCVHDARPRATARMLAALGHDVTLLCRTAEGAPTSETLGGARLVRRDFNDLAPLAKARTLSPWLKAFVRLLDGCRKRFAARRRPITARAMALAEEFWTIAAHAEALIAEDLDGRIDAAHAVGLPGLPAAGRVAKAAGAMLIYDSIELERDRNANYAWPFRRLRLRLEAHWIRRTHAVATPSPEIGLQLARHYRIPLPTAVHNASLRPAVAPGVCVRNELGLAADVPLAVHVGAAVRNRGIMPAIRAVAALPEFHLAIIGPVPETVRRNYGRAIADAGVEDRVHFVPARRPSEIARFIQSADVAISVIEPTCASYAYALPNKLFQPAEAGLPVVVGRTPAMRRVVRRTGVGESVDERNVTELAAAIRRQSARRGSGEYRAARAGFLLRYDAAAAVSAWARLYAHAAAARNAVYPPPIY